MSPISQAKCDIHLSGWCHIQGGGEANYFCLFLPCHMTHHVSTRAVVASAICLSTVATSRPRLSWQGGSPNFQEPLQNKNLSISWTFGLNSVDTVELACQQSKIRDCRDTVNDRVSTTALVSTMRNFLNPPQYEKKLNELEWQYHSEWENMWFAYHLKYIFSIGMGFKFLILFLLENGKPEVKEPISIKCVIRPLP